MDKQKLYGIIMVPVVAIAVFVAWKSYRSTLPPDTSRGAAQSSRNAPTGGRQRGPTPAQMLDEMTKELTLSATQKTRIQAIQEDLAAKRKALPQTLSREERRAKMTTNRAAADTKIKALLSPEQQTKYDALQARRRAQMQAMRPQGGGAPGGGPQAGSGGGMNGGGRVGSPSAAPRTAPPTPGN